MLEVWDLWFPDAGATGTSFARSRVDDQAAGNRLLVHAAPPTLEVAVRDQDGKLLAHGQGLERGQPGPMSYLVRQNDIILLEDGWPNLEDLGRLVILPGGEAGILKAWWHADDHSEWRWQVEFYNHTEPARSRCPTATPSPWICPFKTRSPGSRTPSGSRGSAP